MKDYKIYAEVLEDSAKKQFYEAMDNEHVMKGALMPDAHTGYTIPIGSVIATKQFIFPSFVGYDIGCGMCATKTTFKLYDISDYSEEIMNNIYKDLPVGFNHRKTPLSNNLDYSRLTPDGQKIAKIKNADLQLGTLGGGNHFVEIGYDENESVWIIIHSGSRGFGHGIAQHYMRLASPNNKASEGFYGFYDTTSEGVSYVRDLQFALDFALENRRLIIDTVVKSVQKSVEGCIDGDIINRNHNHAELKDGLWIHRKGATHAEKGMMGVIPGNMRDGSFIVRGKGCEDSLCSSSHGAGRIMGRKQALETLKHSDFVETMKDVTARTNEELLDEAPDAYKNIFEVMELQKDLVDVVYYIKPIINIKG
jgi:tRNA-splicing ligase RtcB